MLKPESSPAAAQAQGPDRNKYPILDSFLHIVWLGKIDEVRHVFQFERQKQKFINVVDRATGLNALGIAVGRNNLEMARLLVEAGIEIIPDNQGRMPSLIAALMRVSDELADYIYEVEERALKADEQEGV